MGCKNRNRSRRKKDNSEEDGLLFLTMLFDNKNIHTFVGIAKKDVANNLELFHSLCLSYKTHRELKGVFKNEVAYNFSLPNNISDFCSSGSSKTLEISQPLPARHYYRHRHHWAIVTTDTVDLIGNSWWHRTSSRNAYCK